MKLLHNNKDLFREVVISAAENLKLPVAIVEKDYYVTLILKLLSEMTPECVFKGGTSLSKCHGAIDRFSEDIDISFSTHLSQGQRKKFKNEVIKEISKVLCLPIADWEKARSRRDYNCYTFSYESIELGVQQGALAPGVKMEVVLSSTAFPSGPMAVGNYLLNFLEKDNKELIEEYGLNSFRMNVQGLERTLIDKIFAICDYYLLDDLHRRSRHIYDIHMLLPLVKIDRSFEELFREVREIRVNLRNCPSAKNEVDISALLNEIMGKGVFESDYKNVTEYFLNQPVPYETVIKSINDIADWDFISK
ncbi:MAG: nucleotidyl transferase AbiEii/AbiGii toxin family protein [Enterococcus sp.]|nr:nucleotidyl transferase AbiEii/AbiGii toxin family protein [Enterococcus sp.]